MDIVNGSDDLNMKQKYSQDIEGEGNAFFLSYLEYNNIIYCICLVTIFWLVKLDVMILSFC